MAPLPKNDENSIYDIHHLCFLIVVIVVFVFGFWQTSLAQTYWPGRFELIAQHPLVVVDGAHNLQGAEALAESLQDVFPDQRPVFVVGVLADKDYSRMLSAVAPLGKAFIAIEPPNPRALSAENLAAAIQAACENDQSANIYTARSIADGVSRACELAGLDGLVCAFGSLYSIAAIETAVAQERHR